MLPAESTAAGIWGAAENDVWAPLRSYDPVKRTPETKPPTLLHFDGSTWTATTGPTPMDPHSISGSSASDVWIAGSDSTDATVVIHWDGTSWTPMTAMASNAENLSQLALVYAASANTVTVFRGASIAQWNGSNWTVTRPDFQAGTLITHVAGMDRDHVYFRHAAWGSGRISVWNGAAAASVDTPADPHQPRGYVWNLTSIAPTSDKGLWVGTAFSEVRHWDLTQTLGELMVTGDPGDFDVAAAVGSAKDVWMVCRRPDHSQPCDPVGIRGGCSYPDTALAMHFDGSNWATIAATDLKWPITAAWSGGPDSVWMAGEALLHVP